MPPNPPVPTNQPNAPLPDPQRVDAFKKNLVYLWSESLDITGLPLDVLINQMFKSAGQMNLPVTGSMIDFGSGPSLAPSKDSMKAFTDAYFARAMTMLSNMPEA